MDITQTRQWAGNIVTFWKQKDVKLGTGAAEQQISEAEEVTGISFPVSFKELYKIANGFRDFDWMSNMFSIWSLERIVKEYRENNDPDFVGFSDFLINSHQIGFRKEVVGIFKHYDLISPMAMSFEEALGMINENSDSIY